MKAIKLSLITLAIVALAGCSTVRPWGSTKIKEEATVSETINKSFTNVPAPAGPAPRLIFVGVSLAVSLCVAVNPFSPLAVDSRFHGNDGAGCHSRAHGNP